MKIRDIFFKDNPHVLVKLETRHVIPSIQNQCEYTLRKKNVIE